VKKKVKKERAKENEIWTEWKREIDNNTFLKRKIFLKEKN
jgi:hypothetical protein